MKVDTVITLDNDVNVLLLDKAEYENSNYFLAVALDDDNTPTEEYAVLKEINENGDIYVEKETDAAVLTALLDKFTVSFKDMVDELPELGEESKEQ